EGDRAKVWSMFYLRVVWDTQIFQQTARFVFGTTAVQPIVTAAVHRGFSSKLPPDCSHLTSPFNLPAPGRRQPLYVVFDLAETCVFVKQSPYALHCGLLAEALLLPKLRSQFAEFLNELSLERLWIFSSSTCVGLGYGSLG